MGIPKILHVCWFGGGKTSPRIDGCMKSIQQLATQGYELRLWNEATYDLRKSERVYDAYQARQWALVSDYVRLDVLGQFGGIYLDTDVEVIRPFDELLHYDFFAGFMWDCALGTAVIGSAPGHKVVSDILRGYEDDPESFKPPNNDVFTKYFLEHVPGFQLTGERQALDGILVLDKYAFEQPSLFRRLNYTVHHFEQSWKANSPLKRRIKSAIFRSRSLWLYRKYVCWKSLRISRFHGEFLRARARGRAARRMSAPPQPREAR